jgi:hypothetical protein
VLSCVPGSVGHLRLPLSSGKNSGKEQHFAWRENRTVLAIMRKRIFLNRGRLARPIESPPEGHLRGVRGSIPVDVVIRGRGTFIRHAGGRIDRLTALPCIFAARRSKKIRIQMIDDNLTSADVQRG